MNPKPASALFTDFYELTMAQAFWHSGTNASATFSFFIRSYPPDRGYLVFAGLADMLDYLERFRFDPEELDYLRALGRFQPDFIDHLARLRFTGAVRALPEGTIFFANEPAVEVTAPVVEAQLIETYLLNELNLQSLLAGKAARVRTAARDAQVIDFGARRTQGIDAAHKLARVSYMVGYDATSNTQAGALYDIPVAGTMAHSFISCFSSEPDAFRAYAAAFPDSSTFLVDTYDTLEGTKNAIVVAREMNAKGQRLHGIRLDSGDLLALSRQTRALLNDAGLAGAQIVASGGLDEFEVDALVRAAAPIDAFGVGTKVGVSADAPWTDCVYKLVRYADRPVVKLSPKKQTLPGPKQVYRCRDPAGVWQRDLIARENEPSPRGAEPLLRLVMTGGRRLEPAPSLRQLRDRFRAEFAALPEPHKALRAPAHFEVTISSELESLQRQVVEETLRRESGGEGR
jgi:nicotinate phosphoribosyltransferase